MLKTKHRIKNTSLEIDSVYAPKSFVLDVGNRISVEYEVYQTEEDVSDPAISPIAIHTHKLTPEDANFAAMQTEALDLIEALSDAGMKSKPEFADAIIVPRQGPPVE